MSDLESCAIERIDSLIKALRVRQHSAEVFTAECVLEAREHAAMVAQGIEHGDCSSEVPCVRCRWERVTAVLAELVAAVDRCDRARGALDRCETTCTCPVSCLACDGARSGLDEALEAARGYLRPCAASEVSA